MWAVPMCVIRTYRRYMEGLTVCRRYSCRSAIPKCCSTIPRVSRRKGVSVDLEIWPKMPHVFQIFAPFVPEANRALERAAGFVRRVAMRQAETAEAS
jgi:hypothetical protein